MQEKLTITTNKRVGKQKNTSEEDRGE